MNLLTLNFLPLLASTSIPLCSSSPAGKTSCKFPGYKYDDKNLLFCGLLSQKSCSNSSASGIVPYQTFPQHSPFGMIALICSNSCISFSPAAHLHTALNWRSTHCLPYFCNITTGAVLVFSRCLLFAVTDRPHFGQVVFSPCFQPFFFQLLHPQAVQVYAVLFPVFLINSMCPGKISCSSQFSASSGTHGISAIC